MFKKPDDDNYKYIIHDYDTQTETDCENYGCDNEGICRCSRITDCKIGVSMSNAYSLFENLYDGPNDDLSRVLGFWYVRLFYQDFAWGWSACGDYYGETLEKITLDSDGGFWNQAEHFGMLTSKEQIEFLLEKEYGSVLPQVQKVKRWVCEPVLVSTVHNSKNTRINRDRLDEYKQICRYKVERADLRPNFQEHVRHLAPLCIRVGGEFEVIDGRHRTMALTDEYEYQTGSLKASKTETFVPIFMWIVCPAKETK